MNRKICQIPSFVFKAFIVLSVFLTILMIIQSIAIELIKYRMVLKHVSPEEEPQWTEEETLRRRIASSEKKYLPDGTLHLITTKSMPFQKTSQNPYSWGGLGMPVMGADPEVEIQDSRSTLIWSGPQSKIPFTYLEKADAFYSQIRYPWIWYTSLDPEFSRDLIFPVVNEKRKAVEYWRYDSRKGYFTGFDRRKNIIGYGSAAGFTDSGNSIQPFDSFVSFSAWIPKSSFSPRAFLLTEFQLYEADFENRSLEKLLDSSGSPITQIHTIGWRQLLNRPLDLTPAILAHRKDQPPILIRKDPLRTTVLQVPDDLLNKSKLTLLSTGQSFYLESQRVKNAPPYTDFNAYRDWLMENRHKPREYQHELYQIQKDGDLVLLNQFEYIQHGYPPSAAQILQQKKIKQIDRACTVSAPPCFAWILSGLTRLQESQNHVAFDSFLLRDFMELLNATYPQAPRFSYPVLAILIILALLHALPRRTGWIKIIIWLLLIFCFNLAGFLTYLSLNHYPVIRCAACGRRRGLNRPDCPACGSVLPPPEPRDVDLIYPPSPETIASV